MITFLHGDIFESGCEIPVNPVNTVGVAGAGLALQFKSRYPGWFQRYFDDCRSGLLYTGAVRMYPIDYGKRFVCCFPTKRSWRNPSQLEWIEDGLKDLKTKLAGHSCAVPRVGAGLGGLPYLAEVRPLIVDILGDCAEEIEVYE